MKKVLWLVSWYPSRVDWFNGDFIQRHARAVAGFCKVHVIYVVKDQAEQGLPYRDYTVKDNLVEEIFYYHSPKTGISLVNRLLSHLKYTSLYRKAVKEYIKENGKPDVLHVHIAMKAGLLALWAKNKWGIPYIVTENWTGYYRQSIPSVHTGNSWFRKMNRKILKEASVFLPVTKDLGETVKKDFVQVDYHVIPNVVNTDLFYYKPAKVFKFIFIHFSYMNHQKNPEGILEAASGLKKRGYDFEIRMIGREDEELKHRATELNLLNKTVFFSPLVSYDQVAVQMQSASAFLLFSRFENLPCVVLEALCCGLPVISSRVGGVAEVIDANNGILVESENTGQLVDAMQEMIDNYQWYNRPEISSRATALFNYATVGQQMINFYS